MYINQYFTPWLKKHKRRLKTNQNIKAQCFSQCDTNAKLWTEINALCTSVCKLFLQTSQDKTQWLSHAASHSILLFPTEQPYLWKSIIICHMTWPGCIRLCQELVFKIIRQIQDTRDSILMIDSCFVFFKFYIVMN